MTVMFVASNWHWKGLLLLMGLLLATGAYAMDASDAPDEVSIDVISRYYEPVEFDHAMHTDLAEDCSVCHHHSTGTGTIDIYCSRCHGEYQELDTVACQDCHSITPFSAEAIQRQGEQNLYHADMLSLKAAYHQGCLGCHQQMEGPVGCVDCHAKTDAGERFYDSGAYAPKASHAASEH